MKMKFDWYPFQAMRCSPDTSAAWSGKNDWIVALIASPATAPS